VESKLVRELEDNIREAQEKQQDRIEQLRDEYLIFSSQASVLVSRLECLDKQQKLLNAELDTLEDRIAGRKASIKDLEKEKEDIAAQVKKEFLRVRMEALQALAGGL
jgi:chromosome segregation ATPase